MTARKGISKKLRFEVFKRDSFTCQYCGRVAPNIILEIDHINPISKGGKNDILNLTTSCFDCNRGKGNKKLTENEEIKKQQEQLKELNEKRNQLKMMIEWKNELNNFDKEQANEIAKLINLDLNEYAENKIISWIEKFGFDEIYDVALISKRQYESEGIEKVFNYIPKICENRKKQKDNPILIKHNYIIATLRNRNMLFNERRVRNMLKEVVVDYYEFETVKEIASSSKHWTEFWETINSIYGDDESGY